MPKGPRGLERFTSLGPFTNITFSDFIEASRDRFYDPYMWHESRPKRLYHVTDQESLKLIAISGILNTDDVFLGAAIGEALGSYALVFDGDDMVDRGFSPRTYLIDENGECADISDDRYYNTNRGMVVSERRCGCYPKPLWNTYKYPGAGQRCDPVLEIPYEVYISPLNEYSLPPYGEFSVSDSTGLVIDKGQQMQQSFVLATPEDKLEANNCIAIIYDIDDGEEEVAMEAAQRLKCDVLSSDEAANMYPELLSDKAAYSL